MTRFHYTAFVDCNTQDEADRVMVERLGYDEDYGFDYTVDFVSAPEQNTVQKGQIYEYVGNVDNHNPREVRHLRVTRVAKDGSWADLIVTQPTTGESWRKRQPLTHGHLQFPARIIGGAPSVQVLTTEEALAR